MMKRVLLRAVLLWLVPVVFMAPKVVWSEDSALGGLPQTAKDHLALAEHYETRAQTFAREAEQHEAMAQAAYKAELYSKAPIKRRYEQMRKHCTPIVQHAQALANDMQAFAAWHRVQAGDLQAQGGRDGSTHRH